MTHTAEYLARVGFTALLPEPTPVVCDDEDDPRAYAAGRLDSRREDHRWVAAMLRASPPETVQHYDGVRWLGRLITWPDRVPDLKTWAGQMTLAKLIRGRQAALGTGEIADLFAFAAPIKGASGLDYDAARDAIDVGFSPAALDMPTVQRPAMELLAVVGLETVPLVSFGRRECGFLHDGRLWRFAVEGRAGGYLHRWAYMTEVEISRD